MRFSGKLNEKLSRTITIIPDKDYPFKISTLSLKNKTEGVQFSFTNHTGESGPEYTVTLDAASDKPGSFSDTLIVKTDSSDIPEIMIPLSGYIMPPPRDNGK